MSSHSLPEPIYAIDRSYQHNADQGPFFQEEIEERVFPPKSEWIELFGIPLATPFGVPAGPLLGSRYIAFAAAMGFDVLTYKTIRSFACEGHPLPNMIYVKQEGSEIVPSCPPTSVADLSVTNSFGMPSQSPDFLMEDIEKANRSLKEGQLMIVSVVGSVIEGKDFTEDFIETALLAKESGAKVIEANFSCPNVTSKEGSITQDPEEVFRLTKLLVKAIAPIPLIIKVGALQDPVLLRDVLRSISRAGAHGVCGINTLGANVRTREGRPALGEGRLRSGVCGALIRPIALEFIKEASRLIQNEKLDLTLLATGGVVEPRHFLDFLDAGADIAMSATGMMWNPHLAKQTQGEWYESRSAIC